MVILFQYFNSIVFVLFPNVFEQYCIQLVNCIIQYVWMKSYLQCPQAVFQNWFRTRVLLVKFILENISSEWKMQKLQFCESQLKPLLDIYIMFRNTFFIKNFPITKFFQSSFSSLSFCCVSFEEGLFLGFRRAPTHAVIQHPPFEE